MFLTLWGVFWIIFIVTVFPSAVSPAAIALGGHYREMAGKLRELVRLAVGSQVLRD